MGKIDDRTKELFKSYSESWDLRKLISGLVELADHSVRNQHCRIILDEAIERNIARFNL